MCFMRRGIFCYKAGWLIRNPFSMLFWQLCNHTSLFIFRHSFSPTDSPTTAGFLFFAFPKMPFDINCMEKTVWGKVCFPWVTPKRNEQNSPPSFFWLYHSMELLRLEAFCLCRYLNLCDCFLENIFWLLRDSFQRAFTEILVVDHKTTDIPR